MEIISTEIIKPSSPTPHYLQNYQLSFLDQISPPIYPATVLFYESNPNINSGRLKSSLSETLTRFYPLAGRLVKNESVHCNDEGVPYIEARTRLKLYEVIRNPNYSDFDKFLPRAVDDFYDNVVLAIQLNFFDCGGLALGICMSHKLADASSRMMFLNSWAATLRDHGTTLPHCNKNGFSQHLFTGTSNPPLFESAMQFPPRDHINPFPLKKPVVKDQNEKAKKIVTKMFVFKGAMLEILRAKFSDDDLTNQECPIRATRIEALTAFLSNRYAHITKASTKGSTNLSISFAVSIRSRMEPPLSKYHFGNYYALAQTKPSIEEVEGGSRCGLVKKIRGALKGIDEKFVVDNIRNSEKYLDFFNEVRGETGDCLRVTSWCRMGVYEVDFGWGKPVRVSPTSFKLKNMVRFLDTKDGDGIEVCLNMEEEDMAKLEGDQEFNFYISPNMAWV